MAYRISFEVDEQLSASLAAERIVSGATISEICRRGLRMYCGAGSESVSPELRAALDLTEKEFESARKTTYNPKTGLVEGVK